MALRVDASTIVERPASEVWAYISNLDNLNSWDPGTSDVIWQAPIGLGSRCVITVGTRVRIRGDAEIRPFEAGRVLGIESRPRAAGWLTGGGKTWVRATYSADPTTDGKTNLTRVFETRFMDSWDSSGPLLGPMARRERSAEIDNIKRILETQR
jgi:hypothetical protein